MLFFLAVVFGRQIHHLRGKTTVADPLKAELADLAMRSLKRSDVPVGSIVTYDGRIIGRGYNTVIKDDDPSGHAEVNALKDAMKGMGYKDFMALDRRLLILYSTFEPCEMCMGTLEHYRIRKVVYLKNKSLLAGWKQQLRSLYHHLKKKQAEGGELQDSLFHLHPDYPGQ